MDNVLDLGGIVTKNNILDVYDSLSLKDKEKYWSLYQEELKSQFDKNKADNISRGDFSYYDQRIDSIADFNRDISFGQNDRLNQVIRQVNSSSSLIYWLLGGLLVILLIKK